MRGAAHSDAPDDLTPIASSLAQRLQLDSLCAMLPLDADRRGDSSADIASLRSEPPPAVGPRASSWKQTILRIAGVGVGLALFAYTMRDLKPSDLGSLLAHLGPICALALVPQALGTLVHTAAWKELLAALKARARYFALVSLFVQSEAVRMALPAGPAIAESLSVWQVKRRFGVPWTTSLAAIATKKAWVLVTHAVCFVLLLVIGQGAFSRLASHIEGGFALGWVAAVMAAMLTFTGGITIALLASRRAARGVTTLLAKLPLRKLSAWAESQAKKPEAAAAARIETKHHLGAALFVLLQWVTEIGETWLILHLVGIPVTIAEAMVVELGGSLVRSLAFVVPGGLGVQDASYVTLVEGLGFTHVEAALAAFVLLKRAKDVFFIALGLVLFGVDRRGRRDDAEIETRTLEPTERPIPNLSSRDLAKPRAVLSAASVPRTPSEIRL